MSRLFAFSGKGGVGKTTLSAMFLRALVENGKKPVLAIDADPNSCLDAQLGVTVTSTIGSARETVREEAQESAMSKQELLRLKIAQGMVEAEGFDLISMGRPEGAGCYCYANNVLKGAIGELADQYPYVVLDNEAGLENLSRRIVVKLDTLVLVSDASNNGLRTLLRLYELTKEMKVDYNKLVLIVNRTRSDALPTMAEQVKQQTGADVLLALPYDEQVARCAEEDAPVWELSKNNLVYQAIEGLMQEITK